MSKLTVAVFDFDGTLTTKDTFVEFIRFAKGSLACYAGFLLFSPLLVAMKLKIYPNWKAKQQIFSYFFKNTPISTFNAWGVDFTKEIDKILRPEALEVLKVHQEQRNRVIVVSASIENWILPWSTKMGIGETLATKIEIDEKGLLTGRFSGRNCYGQEKVDRLASILPARSEYRLMVYGDSWGDKELLESADEGFYRKFK
ncbi:MAG: haloacid dehalogenase-like hydrolase [Pedobacter sp.]|nr:MAG: haloacid dehalogenase-like hydrolase [Pedobacter sp.]